MARVLVVDDAAFMRKMVSDALTKGGHEVVGEGMENKTMQPKEGGITVPAGGSHELVPGGDHIMLMDLKRPLQPGEDVEVTVTFEDGSTLPVTAQIRDFPGAGEEYAGGGDTEAPHTNHG